MARVAKKKELVKDVSEDFAGKAKQYTEHNVDIRTLLTEDEIREEIKRMFLMGISIMDIRQNIIAKCGTDLVTINALIDRVRNKIYSSDFNVVSYRRYLFECLDNIYVKHRDKDAKTALGAVKEQMTLLGIGTNETLDCEY